MTYGDRCTTNSTRFGLKFHHLVRNRSQSTLTLALFFVLSFSKLWALCKHQPVFQAPKKSGPFSFQ